MPTINAKTLRAELPDVVARVRKGARFTVLHRSRPAFRIVPIDDAGPPSTALARRHPVSGRRRRTLARRPHVGRPRRPALPSMKGLFVDTTGWMACADGADSLHRRACAGRDRALEDGLPLATTDFVVDETLTLLRLRLGLAAAETCWRQVDGTARLRWERITVERFDTGRLVRDGAGGTRCAAPHRRAQLARGIEAARADREVGHTSLRL